MALKWQGEMQRFQLIPSCGNRMRERRYHLPIITSWELLNELEAVFLSEKHKPIHRALGRRRSHAAGCLLSTSIMALIVTPCRWYDEIESVRMRPQVALAWACLRASVYNVFTAADARTTRRFQAEARYVSNPHATR